MIPLTILIVGGYGTFGNRIVDLLAGQPRLTLVIAGRSLGKAVLACRARPDARAKLLPAAFDRGGDLRRQIAALRPDLLVDASGPFQAYGDDRYRVVEACIVEGVDYLDLADGSDFVAGIHAFDAAAQAAGRHARSGVSSFPVLTAAVVRRLAVDLARVDSIRGGIAPSPYARVGPNVIRAMAGYAGQPVPLRRNGGAATGHPFAEQIRFTIAPPGRLPLRSRLFSLVDVPDLRALAEQWPEARTIWMGAAPVPEVLHRCLIAFAWLVRLRCIPTLSWLAPLMCVATERLHWGEDRGGMFVEIESAGPAGQLKTRSWHLLVEGDDGPFIPAMAVAALVRRRLAGRMPQPGARPATRELDLDDYEALFADRAIRTGVREEASVRAAPSYRQVLGSAWDDLPPELRNLHELGHETGHESDHDTGGTASGRATVERGKGALARLAAALMGFPKAASDTPVRVRFDVADGIETWTRTFGRDHFSSRLSAGHGRSQGLLCERFGPLSFAMALVWEKPRLALVLRRWSAFGFTLPLWLCPRSDAYETVEDGRFRFHIEISHPLAGLIVRYRGWLAPDDRHETAGPTP